MKTQRERIYLSAPFCRKRDITTYAQRLADLGHSVSSSWFRLPQDDDFSLSSVEGRRAAAIAAALDLAEINMSTMFVFFVEPPGTGATSGGRHFEAGWAYASCNIKRFILIGSGEHLRENVFHCLGAWKTFPTFEEFVESLGGINEKTGD